MERMTTVWPAVEASDNGQHQMETPEAPEDVPPQDAKQEQRSEPLPDPIPLSDPDPPPFPDGIFTGWLAEAVDAVSANTETPKELAASLGLGVIAIAVQGKIAVRVEQNYFEALSIYAASFLTSGHRKTVVVNKFAKPLIDFEKAQKKELEPKIKRAAIERKAKQAQISANSRAIRRSVSDCMTCFADSLSASAS